MDLIAGTYVLWLREGSLAIPDWRWEMAPKLVSNIIYGVAFGP
jgi:hypothetical protein